MNLELNIRTAFLRKALNITLALFISLGFSFSGALADNCQGGIDCLVCAELSHGHVPGAVANIENPGCTPIGSNSTCDIEANQNPDKFRGIVSPVRSYHPWYTGIFAAVSDE